MGQAGTTDPRRIGANDPRSVGAWEARHTRTLQALDSSSPDAMGQQASTSATRVAPHYVPLCDNVKPGDASGPSASDDVKDALSKILEFGAALSTLPEDVEWSGSAAKLVSEQTPNQCLEDIQSSVDSVNELFQYISNLAALPVDSVNFDGGDGGAFDARVAAYVKSLQTLYQVTKREKQRYEQRVLATRMQATSQRKVAPPPLPLPTQNCMVMGWEIVIHLLKATRAENPSQYQKALQMLQENVKPLKPTTYSDSMYLAPSASSSFDALSDCLIGLATMIPGKDRATELSIGAKTIETLTEIALARGSLATLLNVVLWLINQPASAPVDLAISLSKLAGLKEQQLYGKCEASGELYCCGQNSYGELGIGDDIERHQLTSVSLSGWEDIRQVVSGNEVLAILTNGGVVLTCGLNKSGQCGHGHFDERVMSLRPVQALRSQRIKFIAASNGCEHLIALTEAGLAYSWGYNDRGQLGHENLTTKIHLPKLIESLKDKKINFAAVSYHHSAVVTESGELYTFGMNDCGQLGLDHTQHMAVPQHVKALECQEVSMVACGLYHTIVCTAVGELFTFGKNDYGQLGLGHSRQIKLPTLVPLPSEMVCFVACGYYHSSVVTTTGHTYCFGRNDYGQLGIGSKIHQNVPTMVALSATTRMTRATCGCYHTVLLSEQGQVFVHGRNNKGQLGNRSSADSLLPVPLKVRPEKNSRRCVDVAAGFYTTSLIFERKKDNDDGDAMVQDQNCLIAICGRVDIDRSGEIEGLSNFGSVSTIGIALFEGKWFYEVEVVTCGLIQIGWIDNYFQGSSDQGEGVGDHTHSWSYDGNRQRRWNSGSSSYGEKWKAGDVIGCLLDLDSNEMSFYRNGINLGVAFTDMKRNPSDPRQGLMPGISLERGEIIRVNLGHRPFAHPPTNAGDFDGVHRGMISPATAALVKGSIDVSDIRPVAMDGSATVMVNNKIFTIGGSLRSESDASNHVWVFSLETKRWERWSDFPIGIKNHQVVAISDDHILVVGGESMTPTSRHMDLYKCSTCKTADGSLPAWELIQGAIGSANTLPVPRAHHTAVTLRARLDSMVVMYGGISAENELLGDVWYLSLEDFSWSRLPSTLSLDPGPRSGCSSAVIGENVFIFGGQDKEEKLRGDLWRYNTFDRVWHLCYDDNITSVVESSTNGLSEQSGKGEFVPMVPEARMNYSICADSGNIWVFGGTSQSGQLLHDMWCFSVASNQWSSVEVCADGDAEGRGKGVLMLSPGSATALPSSASEGGALSGRLPSKMLLYGGTVCSGGITARTAQLHEFVAMDSSKNFNSDPSKNFTTSGKSSVILGALRAKCTAGTSRLSQQCLPCAADSAVCILAHLDRLSGSDLPGEDVDTIQLSRCAYRSLCVNPNKQTFTASLGLLTNYSTTFQRKFAADVEFTSVDTSVVADVLYPILVVIRLLKLNLFELSRSSLDPAEVGLSLASMQPGGTLFSLREILFRITEHSSPPHLDGEVAWFYRAVKQETAATIYHGFSILFPSLLDRIEVMNKLMQVASGLDPTKKLLVPMLLPCFTSTKMLFQLMSEAQSSRTSYTQSTLDSPRLIAQFASTLLDSLWMRTKSIIDVCESVDSGASLKKLSDVECSGEFKCLNVLIRASVFWCAVSTDHGWPIMESVSVKLVSYFVTLLRRTVNRLDEVNFPPILVRSTFVGKLLPFVLVSVGSLPSVRETFSSTFENFWPHLEELLTQLHSVLWSTHQKNSFSTESELETLHLSAVSSPPLHAASPTTVAVLFKTPVRATAELRVLIGLSTSSHLCYHDVVSAIWKGIVGSGVAQVKKIGSVNGAYEDIYRISLPPGMAKLFASPTIDILSHGTELPQDQASLMQIDLSSISFSPSAMLLSQHIQVLDQPKSANPAQPAPTPIGFTAKKVPVEEIPAHNAQETRLSISWLSDLHQICVWLGSHYAASLLVGSNSLDQDVELESRWLESRLLRGGLVDTPHFASTTTQSSDSHASDADGPNQRNDAILRQIVNGIGAGKKLVEQVKLALDPGMVTSLGGTNPKLVAARLKRQDSVEAALEKSGGIEAVDKAVRIAFAVLLKHSNASYVNDGLSKLCTPSEPVIDLWRSALLLRRWIVREQQKLASERSSVESMSSDGLIKERQELLYSTVCDPVIRRGLLLLSLSAAPLSEIPSSVAPFSLLPGVAAVTNYEKSLREDLELDNQHEIATRQLKLLVGSRSMDTIEEEDEKIQADIFAFLQFSRKQNAVHETVGGGTIGEELDARVRSVLEAHRRKGQERLAGLMIFSRLLEATKSNPSCRLSIIPSLSSAFKRLVNKGEGIDITAAVVEKVHYLDSLEFVGSTLRGKIREEFFSLLSSLLTLAAEHIRSVRGSTEIGKSGVVEVKALPHWVHHAVQEVVQIFEACSIPFRNEDWVYLNMINLLPLITELSSWKSWKTTTQLDFSEDYRSEPSRCEKGSIVPVASGQRFPRIICARSITIGTDLHQLKLSSELGGLAVFHHALLCGRWFWEVSIVSQNTTPVYVGLASSLDDLNLPRPPRSQLGVFIVKELSAAIVHGYSQGSCLECKRSCIVGVIYDCGEKKLDFYIDGVRAKVIALETTNLGPTRQLYPAVGLQGAELVWNLSARVPEKIWGASSGFRFLAPVVSGCLIASPNDGKTISLDFKTKGRLLRLSPDGTTVVAGDISCSDENVETIFANQAFDSGLLYAEIQILSNGRDEYCLLSVGLVGCDFQSGDTLSNRHTLEMSNTWPNEASVGGTFGVLFDFDTGRITLYPNNSKPRSVTTDLAKLKRPFIPSISALCNGAVFRINFHPRNRLELPPNAIWPAAIGENTHVSSSNDIQVGKFLQMQVHSCDGGEFSASHAARNCLLDDASVFSSAKGRNVHIVLRHEVDTPFCVSYVTVRGPGPGYSSPLRHALVFVTSSVPDLQLLSEYDDMTPEEFACLPFPAVSLRSDRNQYSPVAYFVLDGSCAHVSKQLAMPVQGRYVVVKLLCPASGGNIDVGYIGLCGTFDKENGPAYAEGAVLEVPCDECKSSSLQGVTYSLKDDSSLRICSTCYDDNRGSLDAAYFAHVGVDGEGRNDESFALCAPRKAGVDRLGQLVAFKRPKPTIVGNTATSLDLCAVGNTPGGSSHGTISDRSLIWYDDCELFSCGQNNYGELCFGHCNSTTKLEHVPFFSTKSIREIVGGNEVLGVLMKDGTVYTCGLNKSGQCGNGTFEERVLVASPVRALTGIAIEMIAAANGCEHMVAVASDGSVYSWGYNDRGQLGLGSTISKSHTPRLIESLRDKYSITSAAVSYHHSAVITSAGELLTFGMNDCGQLGLDHLQHQHTPQLVDALSSQVVTRVACGLYHTIVVTAGGELFSFGKNDYGQLGLGHARNVKVPSLVRVTIGDSDEKIVDISCGYYHTVAISDRGKLITWGRNDYGQLGIGSKDHKNTPQYVPLPLSSRIKKSSCGCYHTLIMLANGRVMVFGRNNKGQLGAGARTLPSADLPLPIPLTSLSNDEVTCIAAGFYSSYILTGRSNQNHEAERIKDDHSQVKDLAEQNNAEALYESLMKEIDRNQEPPSSIESGPLQVRHGNVHRKLPLLKLHAAAWAMVRALLYQSVCGDGKQNRTSMADSTSGTVLRNLVEFLLNNLRGLQVELGKEPSGTLQRLGPRLDTCITLKNACVGLLAFYSTRTSIPTSILLGKSHDRFILHHIYPHFFRNQILWVLLVCGSTDSSLCPVLASNENVLGEILSGMMSQDLTSATICIRLATLVFPVHSVSFVNASFRKIQGISTATSGDILCALTLMVGNPLVVRPRLCSHELGIERSCSSLCVSTKCLKGLASVGDSDINGRKEAALEESHVASAKAAEVVCLIRCLTLYPPWKVTVNATLSKCFAKIGKLDDILDAVSAYYSHVSDSPNEIEAQRSVEPVESKQMNDASTEDNGARCPESTSTSPEIDESPSIGRENDSEKESVAEATERDKMALAVWQRAKDSLNSLASIIAAVSIIGGHVEMLREGGLAVIEDQDHKYSGKVGVLSSIKKDSRGVLVAGLTVMDTERDSVLPPLQQAGPTLCNVPVRSLKAIERVPPLLQMFDGLDGIISALSVLILPTIHDSSGELDQPHNNQVQVILGRRMELYTKQVQWRATMALGILLKQMPRLSTSIISSDTQLLANFAQTIAAEDALTNANLMNSFRVGSSASAAVSMLHVRWIGIKMRHLMLETERVVDYALDCYEADTRDQVTRKLGQQNALSWGPDAIQSPRKNYTSASLNAKPNSGNSNTSIRTERDRAEQLRSGRGSLPFGVWGVLHPLPQLNENESGGPSTQPQTVDCVPFHLTTPLVRVGRAADSCDLIVNDRSVSGRHFHLRRIRRDGESGPEEYFELQDFSKNGTIVNGVRVHGTSVRISPGSRISLILSRGGLATYEFQVRQMSTAGGAVHGTMGNRVAPPPIITSTHSQNSDGRTSIQGQEYQQPCAVGPTPIVPRSPAEIQNRGSRQHPVESRMDAVRSRIPGGQGLRLITSIAESEVPRALISPNPAVESPRVGGFSSPRSSLLQAPATPAVPTSTVNMFTTFESSLLSPASHQQRESSSDDSDSVAVRAPESTTSATSGTLRVTLGRDSFSRESAHRNSLNALEPSRLKTFSALGEPKAATDNESPALDLVTRLQEGGFQDATVEQCEETLHAVNGDVDTAFTILNERLQAQQALHKEELSSPTVQRLASLLAVGPVACADALHRTQQNVPAAIRLLLSPSGREINRIAASAQSRMRFRNRPTSTAANSTEPSLMGGAEGLISLQEIMEENPSYALTESSVMSQLPRLRPSSPTKNTTHDNLIAKPQLGLWVECLSQVDDLVAQMSATEIEEEESILSGLLTAVHSRQLLEQIVRLFREIPDQADNMLAAFGDPVTLRQLILFTPSSNERDKTMESSDGDLVQESGTIQRILSRTAEDTFNQSSANSMLTNMRAVQKLSAMCRAIDEHDCWARRKSVDVMPRLLRMLLEYEGHALRLDNSGLLHQTNIMHNLVLDSLMHTLSRSLVHHGSLLNWEMAMSKSHRTEILFPKGPVRLSSGIECVVVASYERVWSVPAPDPLLQFRHKWRRRQLGTSRGSEPWSKSTPEDYVTIWRPCLPAGAKLQQGTVWFALGDVLQIGGDSPENPVVMVRDDGTGLLLPPVGFERADVTGKGLPKNSENDADFQRKQIRSVWWPVAPPGYVAFGCVAGTKEDPFQPPALSSVRCIREDLSQRVESYTCGWRAENWSQGPPTLLKALDHLGGEQRRNQQAESLSVLEMASDDVCVRTSLWSVDREFCRAILPVISVDGEPTDGAAALTIRMSAEDKIMCSGVSVHNATSFINVILECHKCLDKPPAVHTKGFLQSAMRPELSAAIFALIRQVINEKLPGSGQTAVSLVRALIRVLQSGGEWKDKDGLLYCRSKIVALQQDQDGGLMLHSLLQALVELMLVVDQQNRAEHVRALTAYLEKDSNSIISLPYRFQFARFDAHKEMLVSHSSKMVVTRHFSGEERKFLLEYHADETAAPNAEPPVDLGVLDCYSCRFEHTPELVITLKDEVKAEIIYFELTVLEWSNLTTSAASGLFGFGVSPPQFPLEGPVVGMNSGGAHTYAFTPLNAKVHTSDLAADHWRWNEQAGAVAIGDIFGCGLRLDTHEVFFTKNGRLLGTAFSSMENVLDLHPTVSVSNDCKFLINFGASGSSVDMVANRVNFTFRFNTMDYDNIMSGFEWYEQLSQVYGVMQALMDPTRDCEEGTSDNIRGGLLPDEFMLAADNFLSEISQDVCIHVESAHPYDLELQENFVSIPLATSIRVKLDSLCETANSHCLQILQGADGPENNSSESEVRAFTGVCGGQEVMIDGDSFVWRFPVQSNFQCRVDRVRKGPYLKLEHRDTRLSLSRDKGWQTAIGVARFDSGIHIWEVRITFVTASSNIFLGIARRDVRLDSYLGKDNRGWGWIGNRALWHNGSKQRGTYGEKFKTGDVVRMTLDLKRGTLSYALNGKDLGVAFGPGGVGPKLEGTFYPGFALYNQRDSIDLIGGHRLEESESLLSGGSGVSGLLPGSVGEDAYYSEDDEEGEQDDTIPNFRMELATALSLMGFPMDWCVYALRHCEDDAEQAADFILANMHVMEALVREESEAHSRRLRHRESLAVVAAAPVGLASGSAQRATNVGGAVGLGDEVEQVESEDQSAAGDAIEETTGLTVGDSSTPQNVDKWGIAFTAVPEFSITGRRLLASKYSANLQELHRAQAMFTVEHDNAVVQIVNEICESRAEALLTCDPLRMAPEEFVPNDEHFRKFQCLDGIPLAQLQKRFLILRNFNCRLQNSLSFIDLSVGDDMSLLARGARHLRGIIFQNVKLAWWLNILKDQQSPPAARPEIEVDRHRAREATEATGAKDSVFAQCFDQLHPIQPSLLRGADRAFKCQFVGEFGDDFGGLYRECLAQMSSELQSNVLPLLKPCPNALAAVGDNRDKFVPNVHLRGNPRLVQMAEFLGKLVGIAIRTKTPLDLNLPAVFWKTIVGQRVTRGDVESIHQGSFQVVDTINDIKTHGITEVMFDEVIDAQFGVTSSARQQVDIIPGGQSVRVLWEDKDDYARLVQRYRLSEFTPICKDVLRGIATILPAPTIPLFTWHEFSTLVCGKPTVDIELLRRRTIYGDGCQASDPHIAYFWEVLNEFTDEQKSAFLRFVWGRSRLPTHAADFTQDFKVSGLPKATGRPDAYLPIAHTCFFSIDLPNYSCREVTRDRLLYAITHCLSIDADNTTVAQRAGQGLNWTATGTATTGAPSTATASAIAAVTASATSAAVATATAAVSSVIAGLSAAISE